MPETMKNNEGAVKALDIFNREQPGSKNNLGKEHSK